MHRAVQEFGRFVSEHAIPAKVRVANGAERVDIGTGTVRFTTPRSNGMRGLSVDVVFIDNDAHRVLESDGVVNFARFDRFREDVALVLNASGGEVVHS
ncbi:MULTISPECIES: hypothetical protein [unclassified Microbacterium]|uniref:hypothetical protein n=1 Tax=unclassified Microbacterium TaxID=2609290 RepID=UPI003017DCA8